MATPDQILNALRAADKAGNTEDAKNLARMYRQARSSAPVAPPAPPKREGFGGAFSRAFQQQASTLGLADEVAAWQQNPTEQNRAKLLEAANAKDPQGKQGIPEFLGGLLGGSAGFMAAPTGAATATALTGVGAPAAPFVGAGVGASQYTIQNLVRQAEEGKDPSLTKAVVAAVPQQALDTVGGKVFAPLLKAMPFTKNLLFKGADEAAGRTEAVLADALKKGALEQIGGGVVRGVGKGVAFEVPQEIAQQALERWNAGLSLTDDEAREEYKQAAIGALVLGGGIGGVSGGIGAAGERVAALKEERAAQAGIGGLEPGEEAPPVGPAGPNINQPTQTAYNAAYNKAIAEGKSSVEANVIARTAVFAEEPVPLEEETPDVSVAAPIVGGLEPSVPSTGGEAGPALDTTPVADIGPAGLGAPSEPIAGPDVRTGQVNAPLAPEAIAPTELPLTPQIAAPETAAPTELPPVPQLATPMELPATPQVAAPEMGAPVQQTAVQPTVEAPQAPTPQAAPVVQPTAETAPVALPEMPAVEAAPTPSPSTLTPAQQLQAMPSKGRTEAARTMVGIGVLNLGFEGISKKTINNAATLLVQPNNGIETVVQALDAAGAFGKPPKAAKAAIAAKAAQAAAPQAVPTEEGTSTAETPPVEMAPTVEVTPAPDYSGHPLVQAHNTKFGEAITRVDAPAHVGQLKVLARAMAKEGLASPIVESVINDTLAENPNADKTTRFAMAQKALIDNINQHRQDTLETLIADKIAPTEAATPVEEPAPTEAAAPEAAPVEEPAPKVRSELLRTPQELAADPMPWAAVTGLNAGYDHKWFRAGAQAAHTGKETITGEAALEGSDVQVAAYQAGKDWVNGIKARAAEAAPDAAPEEIPDAPPMAVPVAPTAKAAPATEAPLKPTNKLYNPKTAGTPSSRGLPTEREKAKFYAGLVGKSVPDALAWLARNAPSGFHSRLALKVRDTILMLEKQGVKFALEISETDSGRRLGPGINGTTLTEPSKGAVTVTLAGPSYPKQSGMRYETALHEFVHAATSPALFLAREGSTNLKRIRELQTDLVNIREAVRAELKRRVKADVNSLTPFEEGALAGNNNSLANERELLTWALVNPDMKETLNNIKYQKTTLFGKFVDAIRKYLGLDVKDNSALAKVLMNAEALLDLSADEAKKVARGTGASAKGAFADNEKAQKAEKISRELTREVQKLATSRTAMEMNQGLAKQILYSFRSFDDFLLLADHVGGALNITKNPLILKAMTSPQIIAWLSKDKYVRGQDGKLVKLSGIKNAENLAKAVEDLTVTRNVALRELADKISFWGEFNAKFKQGAGALADMMHLTTLLNVDPTLHKNLPTALQKDAELVELRKDPVANAKEIGKRMDVLKLIYNGGTFKLDNGTTYTVEGWGRLGQYGEKKGPKDYSQAQRIYEMVKKTHEDTLAKHIELLKAEVNRAGLEEADRVKRIEEITAIYESAQAAKTGVYFPLVRSGDFWLRIGQGKNSTYMMFDNALARDRAAASVMADLRAKGDTRTAEEMYSQGAIDFGTNGAAGLRADIESSSVMLKKIYALVDNMGSADKASIKDQVYQMFLMTLPEADMRKRFTHRQGREGFSADALRGFATSQSAAVSQLSRLEHATTIRNTIGSAYDELKGRPDKNDLIPMIDRLQARADAEISPSQVRPGDFDWDAFAAMGNKVVFFMLMSSPKSALIQMTQLPIVGLPVLSARYGVADVVKTAANYSNLFNKFSVSKQNAEGDIVTDWGAPQMRDSGYVEKLKDRDLASALQYAWNYANDRGKFAATYYAEMTERKNKPSADYDSDISKATRNVFNFTFGAFGQMENISRQIMVMSSAELEYKKLVKGGMDPKKAAVAAAKTAVDLTDESLFDYSNFSKPEAFKHPLGRITFQFMTYPLQMTSYLFKNAAGMVNAMKTVEERREAATKLFGTMGMTALFGGVVALPFYGMLMGAMDAYRDLFDLGDDDEDGNPLGMRSMDLWFRTYFIPHYFGPDGDVSKALGLTEEQANKLALGVEMGPISAMTDLNLGASTSIDLLGMWFRDDGPAASHEEAVQDMFFRLAGPLGGYVGNIAKGVQDFQNGQGDRGLEKMVPAFFRGPLAASRLAREGNLTPDGAEVANAEFYTMGKLVAQSGGFASTSVAELQKTNIMAKRMIKKIEGEKADLLGKLDRAFQRGDEAKIEALFDDIADYNERNYVLPITGETIRNSLSGRMESRGSALNGLVVSPRMQGIMAAQLGNRDINPEEE